MFPDQIVSSTLISVLVLAIIVRLIQKRKLHVAYSWLWLGIGLTMILVVLKYDWLVYLTHLIGAVAPTTTLFILSIIFILLLCLQFSTIVSRHRSDIKRLTQQMALLSELGHHHGSDTNPDNKG